MGSRGRPWLSHGEHLWESVIYAVVAVGVAVLLGCATFVTNQHPVWSAEAIALAALACGLLAYQRKAELWLSLAAPLVMLTSTILVLHFDRDNPNLWLLAIQANLAALGTLALVRLGLHRFLTMEGAEVAHLWQLPLQIAAGMAATGVLLFFALAALVFVPDRPGAWLSLHASWAGWLALATNAIAAGWYGRVGWCMRWRSAG